MRQAMPRQTVPGQFTPHLPFHGQEEAPLVYA